MTKFRKLLLAAVAVASVGAVAGNAAAANLIVNGGFNNGLTIGMTNSFSTLGIGSTAIDSWQILDNNVDWLRGYWQSADGDGYSIELNGNNPGSIGQTINTVIGQSYFLSFFMSGNPDGGGATRVAILGANAAEIGSATYTVGATNSRTNMNWQQRTVAFTADSTSTLISFTSGTTNQNFFGAAIDNVSLAVPEPATWAR